MKKRIEMPVQAANIRINNFDEVALGYTAEMAKEEAQRCLNCKNAPCMSGCPVGVNIPAFIDRIKCGDIKGARDIIKADNSLPSICGRVCPQENQCEKHCTLGKTPFKAVAIGNLERYVGDSALTDDVDKNESLSCQNDLSNGDYAGKRVAVVGSGPASLSCAAELRRYGVEVTIFEALHRFGGVLSYGIPEFRLPKSLVDSEIASIECMGVKFQKNVIVGKSVLIEELLEEFDAVFLGTGAGLPMFLDIEGENLSGVYSANEYLTRVNLMKAYMIDAITPILRGKNVVVVGAGNVAMDSARTARRLGADVTLVYRRSRAEMPARAEEIERAEEEGVNFRFLVNPVKILGNDCVEGIRLVRMELGEPDSSGRRRPIVVSGSEFEIECDGVIVALGTSPNPLISGSMPSLELGAKGTIVADEWGRTSVKRVYCGGDAMSGAATVILAMGAGRKAAKAILEDMKKA